MAGQLGGGALGERGQEDDDDGDHPVVEELRHQETVRHRDLELGLNGRVGPPCPWELVSVVRLEARYHHLDTESSTKTKEIRQQPGQWSLVISIVNMGNGGNTQTSQ